MQKKVQIMLNVTDTKVRLVQKEDSKLKAIASIIIDDCFAVHDIKIIAGAEGVFVAMPSRKTPDGEFKDIAHPINTETREFVKTLVLDAYKQAIEENE
jgi:stage V sporulation protein G